MVTYVWRNIYCIFMSFIVVFVYGYKRLVFSVHYCGYYFWFMALVLGQVKEIIIKFKYNNQEKTIHPVRLRRNNSEDVINFFSDPNCKF